MTSSVCESLRQKGAEQTLQLLGLEERLLHRFLAQVEHNDHADDYLQALAGHRKNSGVHHGTGNGRNDESNSNDGEQHSYTTCPVPSSCETAGKSQQQHGIQNECDGAELFQASTNQYGTG